MNAKRYTVETLAIEMEDGVSVPCYRVLDNNYDVFVGLDNCVADQPFLTIGEARKVAHWLNKWS